VSAIAWHPCPKYCILQSWHMLQPKLVLNIRTTQAMSKPLSISRFVNIVNRIQGPALDDISLVCARRKQEDPIIQLITSRLWKANFPSTIGGGNARTDLLIWPKAKGMTNRPSSARQIPIKVEFKFNYDFDLTQKVPTQVITWAKRLSSWRSLNKYNKYPSHNEVVLPVLRDLRPRSGSRGKDWEWFVWVIQLRQRTGMHPDSLSWNDFFGYNSDAKLTKHYGGALGHSWAGNGSTSLSKLRAKVQASVDEVIVLANQLGQGLNIQQHKVLSLDAKNPSFKSKYLLFLLKKV
jgi:hypothetical protein